MNSDASLRLSVIIPTWNGLRHLPACLDALLPQLPPASEVVLVDNGSRDGTAAWVRTAHPGVHVLALPHNLGFAGGVNAGFRAARGRLLMLLNDDAFVEPECVARLLDTLDRRPECGAIGGVLTFAHRPDLVACAGIRVRTDLLALDLWSGRPVADLPLEAQPIFGVSGGLAVVQRGLLQDVGLFDASFFAYLEDVDFAWRARLRGWETLVEPAARARHVYSATGGQGSLFKQRLLARNRLRVILRCVPDKLLRTHMPAILAYDLAALLYGAATKQPAIIGGRIEALRAWPELMRQRREIQARNRATADLAHWLEPTPPPWQTWREQRRLAAILAQRRTRNQEPGTRNQER
jgi:GT2 family glycosyltransferase